MRMRERLCVELGAMRPDWNRWCMHRDLTPAEGVRRLIAGAVHADSTATVSDAQLRDSAIGEPRARIEIRLTHAELDEVEDRALRSGLTSNRWIVALIRAQLMREPQLDACEMRLLSDSNQQLAVISRWLGQLAREGSDARPASGGRSDIGAIRGTIDAHLRVVANVIRSNLDRWSR